MTYIKYTGEKKEAVRATIYLSAEQKERLDILAKRAGMSKSSLVGSLIDEEYKRYTADTINN